jgi:endonuclease/exonuclease/phosphatase family metal-dependent hydrolase
MLLGGDMNIRAGGDEYTKMLERLGAPIDAWPEVHPNTPGNTYPADDVVADESDGKRIDYWLLFPTVDSGNISLREVNIRDVRVGGLAGEPLSDHLSVEVEIDF